MLLIEPNFIYEPTLEGNKANLTESNIKLFNQIQEKIYKQVLLFRRACTLDDSMVVGFHVKPQHKFVLNKEHIIRLTVN